MVFILTCGEKSWASGGLVDRTEGWATCNLRRCSNIGYLSDNTVDSHYPALDPYGIPLALALCKSQNVGTELGKKREETSN